MEFFGLSLSPYFAMIGKPEILCDAYLLRERESVACIVLLALHSLFVCRNQLFRVCWSLLPGLALGCLSDLCSCCLLDVFGHDDTISLCTNATRAPFSSACTCFENHYILHTMPFWFCCGKRNAKKRLSYKKKDSPGESEDEPPTREPTRHSFQEDLDRAARAEARAERLEELLTEMLNRDHEAGHANNFFRFKSAQREAERDISVDELYGAASDTTGFARPTNPFARMTSEAPSTLPQPLPSYAHCTFPLRPSGNGKVYYVVKKQGVPACVVCGWDRCMQIKGGAGSFANDNMIGGTCRGFITLEDAFNYLEHHYHMKMAAVVW